MRTVQKIFYATLLAVALYAVTADVIYRFRHPELTSTQRLLNIGHVLTLSSNVHE